MTKSVPLLRVATDTRDPAGNSEFLVAIEKQGRFIVKWIQWFVICKLRDHCKLASKWKVTDNIQQYITYDLCSMKKVTTPLRRTIGRAGNSRHKITSSTSIQKWVELYLNPKVYFFLIDIVPQRDFVMINKLSKTNQVEHNFYKIFYGDPKLAKIFGQFESCWLTVAVSSKISKCQCQVCKEHHDQENMNKIIIEFMNKMVARKTIVSLLWYLLIGWAVWIIVNFIEKTVSAWCPGHFYWKTCCHKNI